MTSTCRVFTYSPDNQYAYDYYNACRKFDDIRSKVIDYEHRTDDRESPQYQKMMQEFAYWNDKVPETSNIAGAEEDKLAMKKEEEKRMTNPSLGMNVDYLA